jgi:hypothetical protein
MDLSMKVKIWKVFESKKIKEPKHNSQTRLILHISDVVVQPIKIMKSKFNFNFLDRCLSFCLCFPFRCSIQ